MNRIAGTTIVGAAVVASLCCGLSSKSPSLPNPAIRFAPAAAPHASLAWGSSVPAALAEARKSGKPVVIDLFATWCGPCKMLDEAYSHAPLSGELTKWVRVKVDTDKDPATARKYKAEGLPTLVFLRPNGAELGRQTGFEVGKDVHSKAQLMASIAQEIAGVLHDNRAKLSIGRAAKHRSHRA